MATNKKSESDASIVTVIEALEALYEHLPAEPANLVASLPVPRRRHLLRVVGVLRERLSQLHVALDAVKHPAKVFDPSDPHTIGELIAQTLLLQPRHRLDSLEPFYGSGVYAIYYRGKFKAYQPASGTNTPLYVGKVDPQNAGANSVEAQGLKLYGRLVADHAKNIKVVKNLNLDDFDCRYLVVKSAWQSTAETYLINRFRPIWNNEVGICFGIGKHGDSAKTRANTRSPWDTLHPGRRWAWKKGNKPNPKSPASIVEEISRHYALFPVEP